MAGSGLGNQPAEERRGRAARIRGHLLLGRPTGHFPPRVVGHCRRPGNTEPPALASSPRASRCRGRALSAEASFPRPQLPPTGHLLLVREEQAAFFQEDEPDVKIHSIACSRPPETPSGKGKYGLPEGGERVSPGAVGAGEFLILPPKSCTIYS